MHLHFKENGVLDTSKSNFRPLRAQPWWARRGAGAAAAERPQPEILTSSWFCRISASFDQRFSEHDSMVGSGVPSGP